jgi:hypothetical protein
MEELVPFFNPTISRSKYQIIVVETVVKIGFALLQILKKPCLGFKKSTVMMR